MAAAQQSSFAFESDVKHESAECYCALCEWARKKEEEKNERDSRKTKN